MVRDKELHAKNVELHQSTKSRASLFERTLTKFASLSGGKEFMAK
jgi:hypothetical protein